MPGYRLYTVVPRLLQLIDNLTNWYIRLNRARLKGVEASASDDTIQALNTLFEILFTLVCALAPFIPFTTDHMYQLLLPYLPKELKDQIPDTRSVHFIKFPEARHELFDEDMQRKVARMQKVIELARVARERKALSLKTPLQTLVVVADEPFLEDVRALEVYIRRELNIREVILESDGSKYNVKLGVTADWSKLGKRLKGGAQVVRKAMPNLSDDQIRQYLKEGRLDIQGNELVEGDLTVIRAVREGSQYMNWEVNADNEALILLDPTAHDHLQSEAIARDMVNRVQRLRKKAGLVPTDDVKMEYVVVENPGQIDFAGALKDEEKMLQTALRGGLEERKEVNGEGEVIAEDESTVAKATFKFRLLKI